MSSYKTEPAYLVSGLGVIVYAVYALVSGSVLTGDLDFATRRDDPFDYYINAFGLTLLGAALLYRSLLFIPGNREYHAEPDRSQEGPYDVEPARTAGWALIAALIFLVFVVLYSWL